MFFFSITEETNCDVKNDDFFIIFLLSSVYIIFVFFACLEDNHFIGIISPRVLTDFKFSLNRRFYYIKIFLKNKKLILN